MWTAYLLQKNVQRFQALLEDANTSKETRRVVAELLAEARAKLAEMGQKPWPGDIGGTDRT
jgi:hypothetical protein